MVQVKSYPGGSHRSPHDPSGANFSSLSLAEPSLYATDTLRQLLAIAAGDFTGVAAAMAAAEGSAGGGSGHGPNAPASTSPPALTRSLSNAGDSRPTTSTATPASPSSNNQSTLPSSRAARVGSEAAHPLATTGAVVVDGGVLNSAETCALSDGEAAAFYLTALVAQTMRLEDYWVHLGHQIEVDQHVEFLQYCAAQGFGALKTSHLLAWWRQYRALVRGDGSAMAGRAIGCLQLSDGNPLKASAPPATNKGAAAAMALAAGAGGDSAATNSAPPSAHGRDGSAGVGGGGGSGAAATAAAAAATAKGAKKGRRLSVSMTANAPPSPEPDSRAASAGATGGVPVAPLTYPTHTLAVEGELQRFVKWELEHEWAWRQVPRDPVVPGGGAPPTSPRTASLGSATRRSNSGALQAPAAAAATGGGGGAGAGGAAAKPSRADKAKLQQLQQQEMEAEEQRLARVAALPPENIFLTTEELATFLRFVVEDDLLSHATLHACVASHATRPRSTLAHAAREPVVFPVHVEAPMSVLPLREAVRVSAITRGSSSGPADGAASGAGAEGSGGGGAAGAGGGGGAAGGAAPATAQAARPVSPAGHGKAGAAAANRNRARSKSSTRDAAAAAAAEAAAVEAAAAAAAVAPVMEAPIPTSAMEALRAEQAKEAAASLAAYEEELELSAELQRATRHAEDVRLYFEHANTNTAVRAVYESLEDTLAARQQRILQRVVALERALGLNAATADGSQRLGSAAAGGDNSNGASGAPAAADSKPGSGRSGSTAAKKKGK